MPGKLRMAGLFPLAGALCFASIACSPWSPKDAVGTYEGDYGVYGKETMVIRPDGTFEQTLVRDGKVQYRNQGTWEIMPNPSWKYGTPYMDFHDIMRPCERPKRMPFEPPRPEPVFNSGATCSWTPKLGIIVLWLWPEEKLHRVTTDIPPKTEEFPRMRDVYRPPSPCPSADQGPADPEKEGSVPDTGCP